MQYKVRQLARLQHLSVGGLMLSSTCACLLPPCIVTTCQICAICMTCLTQLINRRQLPAIMRFCSNQHVHAQICSHNILGQLQLDDVWFCLLRHATKAAHSPDDSRMHYDDFCQVRLDDITCTTSTHTASLCLLSCCCYKLASHAGSINCMSRLLCSQ